MQKRLSIVVLTHNDEQRIVDCLECLTFGDELIIIDDNSSDRTKELAKQFTDKIIVHELRSNFSSQRNFALNHAKNEWVLFIDSDEIVTKELKDEILNTIQNFDFAGFFLKRTDYMWGRQILHGEAGEVNLLRMAKKNAGKWHGNVHETWQIVGKKGTFKTPLVHIPHPSMREFIHEVDDYSTLRAIELTEEGKGVSSLSIVLYPLAKFIQNFVFKKGYKDGVPGFIYAMTMSFHSFLVRAKLYQLNAK